ncbi:unnamed protein product [Polarella glacialis]|uniref:EF-hand domain-containing protein n=1 Tax=Polarella glacialis TaxID=89957 RepID=A0A813JPD5_POLGL|nr:unnamed protein product [Polarella glacialis]
MKVVYVFLTEAIGFAGLSPRTSISRPFQACHSLTRGRCASSRKAQSQLSRGGPRDKPCCKVTVAGAAAALAAAALQSNGFKRRQRSWVRARLQTAATRQPALARQVNFGSRLLHARHGSQSSGPGNTRSSVGTATCMKVASTLASPAACNMQGPEELAWMASWVSCHGRLLSQIPTLIAAEASQDVHYPVPAPDSNSSLGESVSLDDSDEPVSPTFLPPPTQETLAQIFHWFLPDGARELGLQDMRCVIERLNRSYRTGLCPDDDARRLFSFLHTLAADGSRVICEATFMAKLIELVPVLQRLSKQLTLRQFRVAVLSAFARFDANRDGAISVSELAAAAQSLGLDLPCRDAGVLHGFLVGASSAETVGQELAEESQDQEPEKAEPGPSLRPEDLAREGPVGLSAANVWERLLNAIEVSWERLLQRRGWGAPVHLADRLVEALQQPGDPEERLGRAVSVARVGAAQAVGPAAELAGSALALLQQAQMQFLQLKVHGLALAAAHHAVVPAVAAAAVASTGDGSLVAGGVLLKLLPVFGAGAFALIDPLRPKPDASGTPVTSTTGTSEGSTQLSEDESLLYALAFHDAGCSAADFQKLLRCQGCRWVSDKPGEIVDKLGDEALKIVVRGRVEVGRQMEAGESSDTVRGLYLRPGSTIGETLLLTGERLWQEERIKASEPVTYVVWDDIDELKQMLSDDETLGSAFRSVLASGLSQNFRIVDAMCKKQSTPRPSQYRSTNSSSCEPVDAVPSTTSVDTDPCSDLSLAELVQVIRAAALSQAACTDGCPMDDELVSSQELAAAALAAGLRLDEKQAESLLVYLGKDGDKQFTASELAELARLAETDGEDWAAGCNAAFAFVAEQTSLLQAWASLTQIGESFPARSFCASCSSFLKVFRKAGGISPPRVGNWVKKPVGSKAPLATSRFDKVHGHVEDLADAVENLVNATATVVALLGLLHVLGDSEPSGDGKAFLTPLITGLAAAAWREDNNDLHGREAIVYLSVFKPAGFSACDFRRLLRLGGARWEIAGGGGDRLCLVAAGEGFLHDQGRPPTALRPGSFFGEEALPLHQLEGRGGASPGKPSQTSPANAAHPGVQPLTMLCWEGPALRALLELDKGLKAKMQWTVLRSTTERLINCYKRAM